MKSYYFNNGEINRYLYIHRTQGDGVEGVHINGINQAMKKFGHIGIIVSPVGESNSANKKTTNNNGGNTIYSLISRSVPEFIFEILEMVSNILIIIRGRKAIIKKNISFIYERYSLFGIAGGYLSKQYNIPIILEVNYISTSNLVRKRTKIFKPLARFVEKHLFRKVDVIATVSTKLKNELIDQYQIPESKIVVTPNASEPVLTKPEQPELLCKELHEKTVIGFVGGFYPWHGLDLLVYAFEILCQNTPSSRLLLVGDGPERSAIEKIALEKKIHHKIIFTGKIHHSNISAYIDLFSIGVMPNSNDYGSPMKIFEYMALGKPYVAPNYSPITEITEGQGKIFKKNDFNSLQSALESYIYNPDSMIEDGKKGIDLIKNKYNWTKNAEKCLTLLAQNT